MTSYDVFLADDNDDDDDDDDDDDNTVYSINCSASNRRAKPYARI